VGRSQWRRSCADLATITKQVLHLPPGASIDNGLVLAWESILSMLYLPDVNNVGEQMVQVGLGKCLAAALVSLPRDPALGLPASPIEFFYHGDQAELVKRVSQWHFQGESAARIAER
jgi:hypothetical protein